MAESPRLRKLNEYRADDGPIWDGQRVVDPAQTPPPARDGRTDGFGRRVT